MMLIDSAYLMIYLCAMLSAQTATFALKLISLIKITNFDGVIFVIACTRDMCVVDVVVNDAAIVILLFLLLLLLL